MFEHDRPLYIQVDYGRVRCTLDELLAEKGMSRRELSKLADVRLDTLHRMCQNASVHYYADQLLRICFCLKCNITDFLIYEPPAENLPDVLRQIADKIEASARDKQKSSELAREEVLFHEILSELDPKSSSDSRS